MSGVGFILSYLNFLFAGVDSLFTKMSCDSSAINDMLGGQQGITNNNVMQHMGEIEKQTNSYLMMYHYTLSSKVNYVIFSFYEPI